ncbi:DNA-directed RNA polymerase III subunit RPC3 [Colletotrichum siamense]|uniref:DNA-directed RNA polymerase III subunit RPC3 n=1 Tax=Colletotrichum siamense TaxID=690259 RepID=A0A9P5K1H7_COLSI|nr:DNA-directed RNA polymerase III subunit RPC3 [Colletotrichum siamense]KAF4852382.1 DNA-directed RNA polymerase III subunit RPC3 [Colletotrichum siamense]KAJ3957480.1 RNA polymerase III subunit C82 [Colletotrichum tropicale]
MLVTKHGAELCAHLVNDICGELPARILAVLFSKGRSNIATLVQSTGLNPRQLRHGLAVLVQQSLVYHQSDSSNTTGIYEANPDGCYNLCRTGKIIEMVGIEYGAAEQEVVQTIMQLGHARVSDLAQAFEARNGAGINGEYTNGHANGDGPKPKTNGHSHSFVDIHAILNRLVAAEIVDQVGPKTFRNPEDVYREIEEEVTKAPPGERTTARNKELMQTEVSKRLREAREESKKLKRQIGRGGMFPTKRRRLANGKGKREASEYEDDVSELEPHIVLRVNTEKCLVELRNQRLAQYAADAFGEITGQVYHTALRLLTQQMSRCQLDPRIDTDNEGDGPGSNSRQVTITSLEILDNLDDSVDVSLGVGKATQDQIDFRSAEKIRAAPGPLMYDSDDSFDESPRAARAPARGQTNGTRRDGSDSDTEDDGEGSRETKVKFEDVPGGNRLDQMRQHLLLLAESRQGFLRHCGSQGRGQWTVDFKPLMEGLKQTEVDAVIEQSFGRHGLRLTRILRDKGKLDEKMLPSLALMKKQDVQGKMLAMQMAGFVDVQEVPKDASRTATRTMFFWFFDIERIESQLVDDYYKTMLRCLQNLEVHRYRERNILSFVERRDVKGKEEEVMTAEHYNKYSTFLDLQSKLLGHVMRLDDLVSVFRDY